MPYRRAAGAVARRPAGPVRPAVGRTEAQGRLQSAINTQIGRFASGGATTLHRAPVDQDEANEFDIGDVRVR